MDQLCICNGGGVSVYLTCTMYPGKRTRLLFPLLSSLLFSFPGEDAINLIRQLDIVTIKFYTQLGVKILFPLLSSSTYRQGTGFRELVTHPKSQVVSADLEFQLKTVC